ncbi:MAG: MerR family transcriptional regulator [Ruminococcaceae bacterium]|nr:MerR family transcriptional regulator [Oscillospiraceae bacterium]
MKTVNQVSKLTGVSVRTLHHYDAIGLLKPTAITESGYRLYDDAALGRLQTILFFRELEFSLKDISRILDNPNFDFHTVLDDQIRLLQLRAEQLNNLISHARQIQKTGVIPMDFSAFDHSKQDRYAAEAKRRWGNTDAYKEFEQKTAGQSREAQQAAGDGLMAIFVRMGTIRTTDPGSPEAQALVKELQDYITDHYYTCTKQILKGLGMMYIAGDEMTANIDAAGGEGTAQFAHEAIDIYCQ